jgi:hypothetical protein
MEKKTLESLDDELFKSVPDQDLGRVAAGYIVSTGTTYEHTVVRNILDIEYVDG